MTEDRHAQDDLETYNPWTVVNLVFAQLAEEGLHPVLGDAGDPSVPAADLLRALGIEPAAEGNRQVIRDVREHLATLRAGGARRAVTAVTPVSQGETADAAPDAVCSTPARPPTGRNCP